MYKLHYSPEFVADFEQIWESVQAISGSIATADRYLRDFTHKIKKKQQFPHSGTPIYFGDYFTGTYLVHFKAYNAFYEIKEDYIELVRALPSKSDYMRILFGEYYEEDQSSSDGTSYLNETTDE